MISFGSLNGSELNAHELNGGHFRIAAGGAASAAVAVGGVGVRRLVAVGATAAAATPLIAPHRRQRCSAAADAVVGSALRLRRRVLAVAAARASVGVRVTARRRAAGVGASRAIVGVAGRLRWRFLHRAPVARTRAVAAGHRRFAVPLKEPAFVLPPAQRSAIVPRISRTRK